ncbi:MAG: exo-rhamnogalacturonan lyase family protein [Planctomycetota bacterium]|jgi:hypothetical protein
MRSLISTLLLTNLFTFNLYSAEPEIIKSITPVLWQQVKKKKTFSAYTEKEEFDSIDNTATLVVFLQTGKRGGSTDGFSANVVIKNKNKEICKLNAQLNKGMSSIVIDLKKLKYGKYNISTELYYNGKRSQAEQADTFFRYVSADFPKQEGKINIVFPRGIKEKEGTIPITTGVPFKRGALFSKDNVRLIDKNGNEIPCQTIVRSRWGSDHNSSIRWLGLDFQASSRAKYWPEKKESNIYLEYGKHIKKNSIKNGITVTESDTEMTIHNGIITFNISKTNFNLLNSVIYKNKEIIKGRDNTGLYLIDHDGSIYRAANDKGVKVKIEEKGLLRTVIRAEGWYVKDGTNGEKLHYSLPTDKLCKFITRLEIYANQPVIRILSTWVITFDSFSVRLKDLGIELPVTNSETAYFGTEDKGVLKSGVKKSKYLIQHLHNKYNLEDNTGKLLYEGTKSAGWFAVNTAKGTIGISNRNTWQRFPKEFEVTEDSIKLHVWPAHGKNHPDIDPYKRNEMHRLWFCHQGKELNLAMPWEYYLKTVKYYNDDSIGDYYASGHAIAGVQSSAMGISITSDFQISFAEKLNEIKRHADSFQKENHAIPDPVKLCDSGAMGMIHHYDKKKYRVIEMIAEKAIGGYWGAQNESKMYGMWIYRVWNNTHYYGDGVWDLYRLYNGTHHYDAYMPWLFYARSGNPFYLNYGLANIRQLADIQTLHYQNQKYPHREFYTRLKRLVGSMKHDNGFVPWGADHMVAGHGTCYNSLIIAYYLTGDLRLKEIITDEWEKTILTDRLNPELADKSTYRAVKPGRETNNALGEMIDLYQLTYKPAILGHMAPLTRMLSEDLRLWGQGLHHELTYRKNKKIKNILIAGYEDYLRPDENFKLTKNFWYSHAYESNPSYVASLTGKKVYAEIAVNKLNLGKRISKAEKFSNYIATGYCHVPDMTIYLPNFLHAIEKTGLKTGLLRQKKICGYPVDPAGSNYTIINEEKDQEIIIRINGEIENDNFFIKIYDPDGKLIVEENVRKGFYFPKEIRIVKDNKTGNYIIFNNAKQGAKWDRLYIPLSDLPEIYPVGSWLSAFKNWIYIKSEKPAKYSIVTHRSFGEIVSRDRKKKLAVSKKGKAMDVEIGPAGAWLTTKGVYIYSKPDVILSISPEKWFSPEEKTLKFISEFNEK